jgi:N-acyl-D-aspartate/D-glutamate deacylase
VAGTFAEKEELFGIARALKEVGHGVFELADEHGLLAQDIEWLTTLAHEIERPVVFNLSQIDMAPGLWKEVLGKLEAAVEGGAPLWAQCAGRAIGILMNFRTTAHPFALHPTFQALADKPWPEQLAALRTPETRAAILGDTPLELGLFEAFVTRTFSKMFILNDGRGYEQEASESLESLAAASGISSEELAYDAMLARDGTGFLYFPLFNYADGNLDVLQELHSHPLTKMGLSDGGAHCGAICDAGMPTFMLTHWTRDRQRGGLLPLEHIIRRQTSDTAAFYGLADRGILAAGYRADVNVIDYEELTLGTPELVFDLPAGGRRLVQRAQGYRYTICAGEITFADGTPTGAMPGCLVRGPQAAPGKHQSAD